MAFIQQHKPLILASGSAIRAQLLKSVGLQFSVVPSGFNEETIKQELAHEPVEVRAARLALEKCLAVAKDYPDSITIGADQMCALEEQVLDKPGSRENAIAQLTSMLGKTHQQHSAVCMVQGTEVLWEQVATASLTVRELSAREVEAYIDHDQPLHSCGSYRMEGMGRHLFSAIEGDHDVIKGLPLTALLAKMHAQDIISMG